ncbi:Uma2 family endonuclease [Megamonas hypermegale]|uniref:Uma2 family endonuclease n=1 Tax=Megamonas hypermegale TaxID=158847 RepID=UPI00195B754E|nr:Uma2 family endonuclease [Megamonas hypermegale]MBM6760481.1 Uma2 family endonuclease [Megamonas hypermegale]
MDNLAYKDDYRICEMIDGVIVMMSPRPAVEHSTVSLNIAAIFKNYLRGKTCRAFNDGIAVFLDDKNYYVPDAMIVCDRSKIKHDGIHGAPDLVVEVLSRGTYRNDRGRKKDVYEKAGVKEYWIVDVKNRIVEVYLNSENGFYLDDAYEYHTPAELEADSKLDKDDPRKLDKIDTEIKVSLYDDLIVYLADVFEDV